MLDWAARPLAVCFEAREGRRPVAELSQLSLADMYLVQGSSLALLLTGAKRRELPRLILGKLIGRPPQSLQFEITGEGKPYLAGNEPIAFNLSHSRSHSLIALSLGDDIGCDIEDRFRHNDDADELGRLVLHPSEQQEMLRLAPPDRQEAFRRYWVRKEAVLKAAGSGFLKDPRAVIVGLDRARPTWAEVEGPVLNLHELRIGADCFAAVASTDAACVWYFLAP